MSSAPRETYVPPINPGQIPAPSPEIFAAMGRENIFRMLSDFYRQLGQSTIRALFPQDLEASSRRSAAFFVQLLGGPSEYQERFGPPRMRARHAAFVITPSARDVWLACFERVLANAERDYGFPAKHLPAFRDFLARFSLWMVNTAESP